MSGLLESMLAVKATSGPSSELSFTPHQSEHELSARVEVSQVITTELHQLVNVFVATSPFRSLDG